MRSIGRGDGGALAADGECFGHVADRGAGHGVVEYRTIGPCSGGPEGDDEGLRLVTYWPNR